MQARGKVIAVAAAVVLAAIAGVLALTRRGGDEARRASGPADAGPGPGDVRRARAPAAARARVAGTVRAGDPPVGGASVRLEIGGAARVVTSDGFGQFELRDVPLGSGLIEVSAPGYAGDSRRLDLRTPAGARAAERLELLLSPCDGELTGTVRDVAGAPLPDAEVRIFDRAGQPRGAAVADGEGRYHVCVAPGFVGTRASVGGYGAQVRSLQVAGSTTADFRLGPEVVIEGRVVDDGDERPVAGAEVRVGWPWPLAAARSDESGAFRIAGLAPGRHRLTASAGDTLGATGPTEVVARVGVPAPPVVLRLERSHLLAGRVVDGAGRPVPGARVVSAGTQARPSVEAVSDDDGRFLLGPLPAGRVTLALADAEAGTDEPHEVVVPHDGELVLARRGSTWLRGRVVRDQRPVAGAVLRLDHRTFVGRSRADGSFAVGPLVAGDKFLEADHDELGHCERTITVADGEVREDVTLELTRGATVSGRVVDQHGAPVAGAWISLWSDDGADHAEASSAADGTFTAINLEGGGRYKVSIFASWRTVRLEPAGAPFPPIDVPQPTSRVEGLKLAVKIERGAIAGVVRRPGGEPVADARVSALGGGPNSVVAATSSDEQGRFELADLLADQLDVVAATSETASVRANDVAVGKRDLVLTLPAAASLRGELVGFSRPPQVTVSSGARFEPRWYGTPTAGGFVVEDLVAGTYVVRARAGGELAEARVTVVAGAEARVTLRSGGAARLVLRAVAEETGAPLAEALCGYALASDADSPVVYDRTDGGGQLALDAPAGHDLVLGCKAREDGEEPHPIRRRLAPGETATVAVSLARRPYLGLTLSFEGDTAVVTEVGGPAAAAGIVAGDVIVAVDGTDVTGATRDVFFGKLFSRPPGDVLRVALRRGDTVGIVVGRRPERIGFGEL